MSGLGSHLAAGLDPVVLAERVGMKPQDWQARVLRSTSDRLLLNCSRQAGKSTIASLLGLHCAVYEPGSLVLILSPSERQSKELFRKCLVAYRSLGRPVPSEAENRLSLELENGSRVVSLPGTAGTIRGFSNVAMLIIDEAAQVEDDIYLTVLPMLAVSGGRLIAMSTPFGRRGWFYDAWQSDGWEKIHVPADQVAHIRPEFLAEARASMGSWWFRQEYDCEFMDAATAVFGSEDIEKLFSEEVEPWTDL